MKILEKFNKRPQKEFIMTYPPFEEMGDSIYSHSLRDSLKFAPIGGSVWKNFDYLTKMTTLRTVKSVITEIYFTKSIIPEAYENNSIA